MHGAESTEVGEIQTSQPTYVAAFLGIYTAADNGIVVSAATKTHLLEYSMID